MIVGADPSRGRWPVVGVAAVLLALAGLGALAVLAVAAPPARPADAAPAEFSAARAGEHVAQLAQRPHPLGTDDNVRVREHIVAAARQAGADVRVESGEAVRTDEGGPFPSAVVHNVIARMPGSAPETSGGKALLLVAHYDSVPTGPGAGDDGAAVAAMLETMRALRAAGGVRNDVVFLFTDGEELGLLGATMFVGRHGVGEFGAVLNWEGRGSRGPVWMFETGGGNHPLVRAFAAASPRPVASSLTDEVYQRLPNDTDFTVFRQAGASGLNAAFLEGLHDYHSASDTPQRLSADSVQHHGESMLGLVRVLGDTDLRTVRGGDAVYFDLFARIVVHYPEAWAVPLGLVSALAVVLLAGLGWRRSALRPAAVLAVAGVGLGVALVAGAAAFGLWRLVLLLRPDLAALPLSEPYERAGFAAGFTVLALAALLLATWLLRRRTTGELLAGWLVVLGALLVACVFTLPGVSYLLQWPVVAGLPALWWTCRRADRDPVGLLLAALAPAVSVVLFAPLVDNLLVAIGIPLAAAATAIAVLGGLVLLPLLAGLPRPGRQGVVAALAAVLVLGVSVADSGFAPREPRPNAIIYVRDAVDGKALWLTGDPRPDAWTARALGERPASASAVTYLPQFADRPLLTAPAPMLDLAPPTVEPLTAAEPSGEAAAAGTRTVRFRVASARGAWKLQIRLPVEPLRACTIGGQRLDAAALAENADETGGVVFHHYGATADGVSITCELAAGSPLPVEVCDYTTALPPEVAALLGPRPPTTVPAPYGVRPTDTSVVRHLTTL